MAENFKTAAENRFKDARILFDNGRWTGTLYMARLGLECALKDKFLRRRRLRRLPVEWYTHDLWKLLKGVYTRPIPKAITIALAEINAVDVNIRYTEEAFDRKTVDRFLAKIQGVARWLNAI